MNIHRIAQTILSLALCFPLLAQEPAPIPTPKLISISRLANGTHADLTFSWDGDESALEWFQIVRRAPGKEPEGRIVNPMKCSRSNSAATGWTYTWTDKRLDRGADYTYSIMAVVENVAGEMVSSPASEALEVKAVESK